MAFQFMLMAAQAAGIGLNAYAQRRSDKRMDRAERRADASANFYDKLGSELDMMQLETRMQEEQLQATQSSILDVEQLREVMSTQRAIFGARNQMPGQGSARAIETRSQNLFNADERAKQMSQTFRQNQMKSQMRLAGIQGYARQSQRAAASGNAKSFRRESRKANLIGQGLNMFSFNQLGQNPFAGKGGTGG